MDIDELGKQIQERNAKDKNVFQNLIQEAENDIESNKKSIALNRIALVFSLISVILNVLQITVQHQKDWMPVLLIILLLVVAMCAAIEIVKDKRDNDSSRRAIEEYKEQLAKLK